MRVTKHPDWVEVLPCDIERERIALSRGIEPEFTETGYYRETASGYSGPYTLREFRQMTEAKR